MMIIMATGSGIKHLVNGLKAIAEGWGKSLGIYEVTEENKRLSKKRMAICADCEHARTSNFLKILGREAHQLGAIICEKCPTLLKCPVNEKTLVESEKCPIGKW